jgi:hypothetical protein
MQQMMGSRALVESRASDPGSLLLLFGLQGLPEAQEPLTESILQYVKSFGFTFTPYMFFQGLGL